TAPHTPWMPTPEFRGKSQVDWYGDFVAQVDDAIGRIVRTIDDAGLGNDTLVIFTSDNGGVSAGDAFSTSNLPLRGGKGYQFEGGIREPYFIKVPWLAAGGQKCDTPVTGTDFYPTLLELAGIPLKPYEHADGMSLVPLLKGKTIPGRQLVWHYPHYGNQGGEPSSVIRLGDWKLIHYYEDGRQELYNLRIDGQESTDVARSHPAVVGRLSKRLFAYLKEVGARFPEKDPEYREELEKKHLEEVLKNRLPQLEKQRLLFLSKDFDPGNNWWGSKVTRD
ncbi:MAG TPA: sulfatase-like hydrolase/transferase, partial [Petrimonas sp.]|nr:sulfatase-like hydrolase/transferase [Petrimonas sp.]